jgi:hypothetical protein
MKRDLRRLQRLVVGCGLVVAPCGVLATDVTGVRFAALDQPRINTYFSLTPGGPPIIVDIGFGFESFNVQAFLDTGASGMLMSAQTAEFLGIQTEQVDGADVIFSDVGVGGSDDFFVSQPLHFATAKFNDFADVDNIETYSEVYSSTRGPVRLQVGPQPPPVDPLLGSLDVFGMPMIKNRVMVMDARPTNQPLELLNTMATYLYEPGTAYDALNLDFEPGIVPVDRLVRVSKASFDRFTTVTPAGAPGPSLEDNPFIGKNPSSLVPVKDVTPGVKVSHNGRSVVGSFLFDTGAATSFISLKLALRLGVRYVEGTFNTDFPELELYDIANPSAAGTVAPNQFTLDIGGIGGTVKRAGLYFDAMLLSTTAGLAYDSADANNINFLQAPLIVADITLADPNLPVSDPRHLLTLDGVFGVNYLVGTAEVIPAFPAPIIDNITPSAFDFVTYDDNARTIGFDFSAAPRSIPEPGVAMLVGVAGIWGGLRRRV